MAFSERRIIALDSIAIRRSWETPEGEERFFHGLLGASLSVYEAKDFVSQYQTLMDALFKKEGLPREKLSYKAAEIYSLLTTKPRVADSFVHEFSRGLLGIEGTKFNLFVGTFDIQELIRNRLRMAGQAEDPALLADMTSRKIVPIYGQSSGTKLVTVPELIDRLENPFPALCAWKLTQVTGIFKQQFLLDNFEGEESRAWQDLIANNRVFLIPKGSACNPYISAIDIFLRSVNRVLERKRNRLSPSTVQETIEMIGKDLKYDAHVLHVSNEDIDMIKPITPKQIPTESFVKHPIFFVYNEQDVKGERAEIENSPLMRQLHDLAYEKIGGVLFYNPDSSTKVITDGDFFVAYGPKGEAAHKRLRKLGYKVNLMKMEREG